MKVERYINDAGEFRCFAIDNTNVSRNGLVKILSQLPEIEFTMQPKFWHDAVFCEFIYNGHKFYVEEPYGDNTTYDVVAPAPDLPELKALALLFEQTEPTKGCDWGHNLYFLVAFCLKSTLAIGLLTLLISWLRK